MGLSTSTSVRWSDIPMSLKIFYPNGWEIKKRSLASSPNIGLHVQKDIATNTSLFLLVNAEKFENNFSDEDIAKLTDWSQIKSSTNKMGSFVCSQQIIIDEAEGVWMLHKTTFNGLVGYRISYVLYFWKYCFSLIYGTVSDKDGVGLSLYKEYDDQFYYSVVETKLKWIKGK